MVVFSSPLPPVRIPEVDLVSFLFREGPGASDDGVPPTPHAKTVLIDGVGGTDRLTWQARVRPHTDCAGRVRTWPLTPVHGGWEREQELRRSVDALASGLHALGFRPGDVLGIYSPNHVEYAVALLAAIRLGALCARAYRGHSNMRVCLSVCLCPCLCLCGTGPSQLLGLMYVRRRGGHHGQPDVHGRRAQVPAKRRAGDAARDPAGPAPCCDQGSRRHPRTPAQCMRSLYDYTPFLDPPEVACVYVCVNAYASLFVCV
jgi:hypothetical protein